MTCKHFYVEVCQQQRWNPRRAGDVKSLLNPPHPTFNFGFVTVFGVEPSNGMAMEFFSKPSKYRPIIPDPGCLALSIIPTASL